MLLVATLFSVHRPDTADAFVHALRRDSGWQRLARQLAHGLIATDLLRHRQDGAPALFLCLDFWMATEAYLRACRSACVARRYLWYERIVWPRRGIEEDSLRTPVSFLRTTPGGHQRNRFAGNWMGTLRRDVGTAAQRPADGSSLGGSTLSNCPFCRRSFPLQASQPQSHRARNQRPGPLPCPAFRQTCRP